MEAPTVWQTVVAIVGACGVVTTFLGFGVVYGKLTTRLDILEKSLQEGVTSAAKVGEVRIMFDDIRRRLERIEHHFDGKGDT